MEEPVDAQAGASPERCRVALEGEIDIAAVTEMRSALLAETAQVIEVDVSGVTFMDSSGLAGLLDVRAALADEDRRIELVDRPRAVVRLLEITGLTDGFGPVS